MLNQRFKNEKIDGSGKSGGDKPELSVFKHPSAWVSLRAGHHAVRFDTLSPRARRMVLGDSARDSRDLDGRRSDSDDLDFGRWNHPASPTERLVEVRTGVALE